MAIVKMLLSINFWILGVVLIVLWELFKPLLKVLWAKIVQKNT